MSNAEQDTGQNKNTENNTEWDSLATPFDTSEIENPTQDDLSYEAWLKSNANPDVDEGDDSDVITTPFDTSKIENPTQDDLSYEAWLKSNANPDFPTDRDGNPNSHYEGPVVEDTAEDATESEDGREYDPAKSRWSQMTEQEKEDLLHKYPRQEGENTNDWGKRIEASEGYRIFGVEAQEEGDSTETTTEAEKTTTEAERTTTETDETAAEAEETAAKVEETTTETNSRTTEEASEETAPEETTSEETASEETAPAESADESSEDSGTEEATEQPVESTEETAEQDDSAKEAPAVETEADQEDAEKIKDGLLAQLGGGKMAEWVEGKKKITRGQMKEMSVDALQGLIDEYNDDNNGPDGGPDGGLDDVPDGEDLGGGDNTEGSMAGQAMDMPPVAEFSDTNEYAVSEETHDVDADEMVSATAEQAEKGVESFEGEAERLNSRMDSILNYQEQSSVWEAMHKLLDKCDDGVKNTVKYARQERLVNRTKDFVAQYRRELRSLPLFTLPWSEARARKNVLRSTIESTVKSLNYYEDELKKIESSLPESLSDEEQGQVDAFGKMDTRMDRINADLHTRSYLGDIRMREKWIRDQEKSIADDKGDGVNAPSVEKRRAFIAKTRVEISNYQASIDGYQEAHPDFVLRPGDGFKNPSYEDIMGGYDDSPEVNVDEEDDDVEDFDAAA